MEELQIQLDAIAACLREKRFSEAIRRCQDILIEVPMQPDVLYTLGMIAFQMQRADQSLAVARFGAYASAGQSGDMAFACARLAHVGAS